MSEKKKNRVNYEVSPTWNGDGFSVSIHTTLPVETAQEALDMVMSMYKLEDPDDIEVTVTFRGIEAVDTLFKLER
jgi:hypothetical protein